jgi:phosphoenolpyruvate carboxykinase (GTP)
VPAHGAIDLTGLDVDHDTMNAILDVDTEAWRHEVPLIEAHFERLGERLPDELRDELRELEKRLAN